MHKLKAQVASTILKAKFEVSASGGALVKWFEEVILGSARENRLKKDILCSGLTAE